MLAAITLGGALASMTLRNLVHCALCLVLAFAGLAGIYLELQAPFIGFAQVLVYVGAVTILIVFAVLLTRGAGAASGARGSAAWPVGVAVAGIVGVALMVALAGGRWAQGGALVTDGVQSTPVKQLGERLMTTYLLPLEVVGLLLTAALIGAAVIAMPLRDRSSRLARLPGPGTAAGDGTGGEGP